MNELTAYQQSGLPAQPAELAKFILIAPEKVKALKAEIRAIEKAQLAEAVRQQKREELSRLCGLIVLADARMGEITREMPKGSGGDRRSEDFKVPAKGNFEKPTSQGQRTDREPVRAGTTKFEKTKKQAIQELGLSTSQVSRMEQMAAHPDIVEEVIAESQAGQIEATQGEVLRRIKERNNRVIDLTEVREERFQEDMAQINRDYENLKHFRKATALTGLYEITDEIIDSVINADDDLDATIDGLGKAVQKLEAIKYKLLERRMRRGKKNLHTGN